MRNNDPVLVRAKEIALRDCLQPRQLAIVRKFDADDYEIKSACDASRVYEALKKENLPGVFGLLRDLVVIDDEDEAEISEACPQLSFIVVSDIRAGVQCIQLSKKLQLPAASFLVLEMADKITMTNPVDYGFQFGSFFRVLMTRMAPGFLIEGRERHWVLRLKPLL